MFLGTAIWKLIISYASCVCIFFMWYWLYFFFHLNRKNKSELETYKIIRKFLLILAVCLTIVPSIILFIINLNSILWIEDLWASITSSLASDITEVLILLAFSIVLSFVICYKFFYDLNEAPFKWKDYLSMVYLVFPAFFLFLCVICNIDFITIIIIIGFIGLILSGAIISL